MTASNVAKATRHTAEHRPNTQQPGPALTCRAAATKLVSMQLPPPWGQILWVCPPLGMRNERGRVAGI